MLPDIIPKVDTKIDGKLTLNSADVSSTLNLFINKISAGLGVIPNIVAAFSKPIGTVINALAEAKKNEILASKDIEIRAMLRFEQEEIKKQANMESIAYKSVQYVKDDAKPNEMDDDWITEFFEHARKISNEDVQELWAKLLAGEANEPKSFSKKTMRVLADLDKEDAELFSNLCRFVFHVSSFQPIILEVNTSYYMKYKINFNTLNHLDSLGLIQFNAIGGLKNNFIDVFQIRYGNNLFKFKKPEYDTFNTGHVIFTVSGFQLFKLTNVLIIEDYADYAQKHWESQGHIITRRVFDT